MAITQAEYDELQRKYSKRQEIMNRMNIELKTARAELEALQKAKVAVEEQLQKTVDENPAQKELASLKDQLRMERHRVAFERVAKEKGAADAVVDSIWRLMEYQPTADVPDVAELEALMEQAKARPGVAPLFGAGPPKPEMFAQNGMPLVKPGVSVGQAGKSGALSPYAITDESDPRISDVKYQYVNFDRIAAAASERIARGEI